MATIGIITKVLVMGTAITTMNIIKRRSAQLISRINLKEY
jgi:hypothetical protein